MAFTGRASRRHAVHEAEAFGSRPAEESPVDALRAVARVQATEMAEETELWPLRLTVIDADPVLVGTGTRADADIYPTLLAGVAVILAALVWLTTLSGATSVWTVGAMFFVLGAGFGLITQNVVLPRRRGLRHAVHKPAGRQPGRRAHRERSAGREGRHHLGRHADPGGGAGGR